MPINGETQTFEQCSAVYEALAATHRDGALIYLMDKFGPELVNQWLELALEGRADHPLSF